MNLSKRVIMKLRPIKSVPCCAVLALCSAGSVALAAGADVKILEPAPDGQWELVFSDEFKREETGQDWRVLSGEWEIQNNALEGYGVLLINRRFRGLHRIKFSASSEEPCDLSPFIHSGDDNWREGYFLQFGGSQNTRNTLRRLNAILEMDYRYIIQPGWVHDILAEFDGKHVRLEVDGVNVFKYREEEPLTGESHEQIGIYVFNPSRIEQVKVYLKAPGGN